MENRIRIKERTMDINETIREQYDMTVILLQYKKTIYENEEEHFYLITKVSFYILSVGLWGLRHDQLLG